MTTEFLRRGGENCAVGNDRRSTVGAGTTLNIRENQKIRKSMGNVLIENTMKKLFVIVGVILFMATLNSCKPLRITTLDPKVKNKQLLPPLDFVLETTSFGTIFGEVQSKGNIYGNLGGTISTETSSSQNPRINDFNVIFQRDVLNNICELYGDKKGKIRCQAVVGKDNKNFGWMFLSIPLCFIPNFLGMPIYSHKTKLQIEVTIYDVNNRLVGKYTSDFHKQKSYAAMYWGYSIGNTPARNVRLIFTECMEDIKRQIEKDYNRLNEALQ